MKKLHFTLLLVCLAALPALLSADTVVEEIIARVNNSIVTRSEYLRSREQLKDEAKQQAPSNFETVYAEKERDVLRDLIDQQLLLEKGKDLGITADTELIKKLDEMRKQMNLESMEDLEKAATAQGVSYEDFKQNLRNQIITQQVIGREVGSHLNITKEEEQKFYDQHKSEMEQPEQIRLSEILVSIPKEPRQPRSHGPAAGCGRSTRRRWRLLSSLIHSQRPKRRPRDCSIRSRKAQLSRRLPRSPPMAPVLPREEISANSNAVPSPKISKTGRLP